MPSSALESRVDVTLGKHCRHFLSVQGPRAYARASHCCSPCTKVVQTYSQVEAVVQSSYLSGCNMLSCPLMWHTYPAFKGAPSEVFLFSA